MVELGHTRKQAAEVDRHLAADTVLPGEPEDLAAMGLVAHSGN